MALETRPGCSIFPPHLLKVLAGRQRHAMAHQNGLVALRMMHIFFLGDKLDRVAEDVKSMFSSISLRSIVAPRTCYMGVNGHLDLIIGFSHHTLPLDGLRNTLRPPSQPPGPNIFKFVPLM